MIGWEISKHCKKKKIEKEIMKENVISPPLSYCHNVVLYNLYCLMIFTKVCETRPEQSEAEEK